MKRFCVILCLVLLCLSGCSREKTLSGEVTEYRRVDGDGELYSIVLTTEKGKEHEVFLRSDTGIFSWIENVERETFLDADLSGLRVDAECYRAEGMYFATNIWIEAQMIQNALTLEDGTPIDVTDSGFSVSYSMENGVELLAVREPTGPENVHTGNLSYNDLSETAKEKILSYYAEKGLYYDVDTLLEEAYDSWCAFEDLGAEFNTHFVSQEIYPTAGNDRIICFMTDVLLPGEPYSVSIREGAVFDPETGEHISGFDLFRCSPEELEAFLMDQLDPEEPFPEGLSLGLQPENIVLYPDNMDVNFRNCQLPGYGEDFCMGVTYADLEGLIHPWAVPEGTEE